MVFFTGKSFTGDLEMKTKLIIKVKTVMLEAIEEYNLSNEKVLLNLYYPKH